MVSHVFQDAMSGADDPAFASDIPGRSRVATGVFRRDDYGITYFEPVVSRFHGLFNRAGLSDFPAGHG